MGVVLHMGRTARMDYFGTLFILCTRRLVLRAVSIEAGSRLGTMLPHPYCRIGLIHALAALWAALGSGPCFVLVSPFRW